MKPYYLVFILFLCSLYFIYSCKKEPSQTQTCYTLSGTLYTDCNHTPFANKPIIVVVNYWAYHGASYPSTLVDSIETDAQGEFSIKAGCGIEPFANNVYLNNWTAQNILYNTAASINAFNINDTMHLKLNLVVNKAYTSSDTLYYTYDYKTYHIIVGPFSSGNIGTFNVPSGNLEVSKGDTCSLNWKLGYFHITYENENPNVHLMKIPHSSCSSNEVATITLN